MLAIAIAMKSRESILKIKRLNRNLWPLFLFFWKIFIWTAAPTMNKTMKIVCAGTSIFFTGGPPNAHTAGGYGGFMFAWATSAVTFFEMCCILPLKEACHLAMPY